MATTAQIDILINTAQSAKTLGELDKALGEINKELKEIPIGSESFKRLKTQADLTAKAVNEINISGFDKKVAGFEAASKTISSSLALATGSMALFGSESEETQKILQRVGGALAISTAFKDFTEAQKAADAAGKGLNKTLLGNPFVLIAAVLLPLLLEMDEFKDILALLSGVFKDIMKALKPLLDAFMMLLNSVLKAIIPIVKIFADILIKALNPILGVISKVVAGLSPIFERLGKFLEENTFLVDALTAAIQVATAPLQLLGELVESFSDKNTIPQSMEETKTATEDATKALEDFENRQSNLASNIEIILEAEERKLALSKAQGKSTAELRREENALLVLRENLIKNQIAAVRSELQRGKVSKIVADENIANLQRELDAAKNATDIFRANNNKADSEASKARQENLRKIAADLQKTYLDIRDINKNINLQFASLDAQPFVGFFEDIRKTTKDIISKIPEESKPIFTDFFNFLEIKLEGEQSFGNFSRRASEGLGALTDAVSDTTTAIERELFNIINSEAAQALPDKLKDLLKRTFQNQFKVIVGDAKVFKLSIENSFDDVSKTTGFYVDLFNKNLKKFKEGFDFTTDPLLLSFDLLNKDIKEKIKDLNEQLQPSTPLTIIQRQRLEAQRDLLVEFLETYKNELKSFTEEDIINSLSVPLEKTFLNLFDDLRTGTNEFAIDFFKSFSELQRQTDFPDEFVDSVRKSLISLGIEAEKVDKAITKLFFRTSIEFLQNEERLVRRQAELITKSAKEREDLLRRASEIRIAQLRLEIERANQLNAEENERFQKDLKKRLDEGKITQEEYDNEVNNFRIKNAERTARIISNILGDIDAEEQNESLRKLQRFADTTTEIIGYIQEAASSASEILSNISQQLLIDLQNTFDATVSQLDAAKEQGLLTQREFDFERLKAEERYEKRRKQIEKAAWERQYAAQLFQAIAGSALAVINALAQFPGPPFTIPAAVTAGVLGAAQVAVIATQPKPRFRYGGLVPGMGPDDSDTIDAKLSPGEFVVNGRATKRFLPLLSQLNQFDKPTIGARETNSVPNLTDLNPEPVRAYVVLDELNEKNELLNRIQNNNTFFRTA